MRPLRVAVLGEAPMHRSKEPSTPPRWAPNSRARGGFALGAWPNGTTAWTLFAAALAGIILLPLGTILLLALGSGENVWPHLMQTVLPRALADTLMLMGGVGILSLALGTAAAWLVTMYRFPGRGLLDRLLVLPLAMPTYIVAYCYVELLDYSGPVQQMLRALFGWRSARDYWFPEVRTLGGCVLVLSSVLYPYVYLSARASFAQQSVCVLEVARTLGQTPIGAFRSVALPLARPALAAGVALTLMECLNDLGAAQYLGVQTLTVSIYTTWLQHNWPARRRLRWWRCCWFWRCSSANAPRAAGRAYTKPPGAIALFRSPTWRVGAPTWLRRRARSP